MSHSLPTSAPPTAAVPDKAEPQRYVQLLASRVPLGVGMVVQIGCGEGLLGAALRRRDPATRLIGTEADATLAAQAERHFDLVHRLDPETPPPLPAGSVDVLVLDDILPRLRDPAAALRRHAQLLKPDGVLLAAVPNAEHWRFARHLLAGTWRYGPEGPLDLPHLRLFTRETLRQALEQAGLVPADMVADAPDAAAAQEAVRHMTPALEALGIRPEEYLRRATPRRLLWRATRGRPTPLVIVAQTLRPVGGVNDVRIDLPLGAVATRPGVMVRISQAAEMPALPAEMPRIMILQRRLLDTPQAPAYVNAFRSRGWLVVQEFDDDPAHWPVIAASGNFAFRGVHAVQTSTEPLAALFRQWNPEVAIFPNTAAELPEPANFADPQRLTLFLGALRREEDMAPFLPALNRVLAAAGERLAVEVLYDRRSYEALTTPHKRFSPILPYAEYRALMARCEIAFLPLADTRFNNFKSDLKFVEASAHRLCCLASPVVYGGTIRDGETGLIIRGPEELEARLLELLAVPERARAMGEAARGWVRSHRMLAGQVDIRLAWYRSLWERRAELDAALLRRAPELGAPPAR